MKRVPIRELKEQLSAYLTRVKVGEEVIVTDRGRPIARLVPIGGSEMESERLLELEKQGLVTLGSGRIPADFWEVPRPSDARGDVLRALLEEREEGR